MATSDRTPHYHRVVAQTANTGGAQRREPALRAGESGHSPGRGGAGHCRLGGTSQAGARQTHASVQNDSGRTLEIMHDW